MDPVDSSITFLAAVTTGGETSGSISGLFLSISIAIGFSFLCSLLEAGLLSASPSYLETQAQSGSRSARLMLQYKQNIEDPITAILTLNTIAHTVGATVAGAEAAGIFGNQYIGVISGVMTFLILAFSEILPKTLGAVYWRELLPFTAYALRFLLLSMMPAVWGFKLMTRLITSEEKLPTVSRSELAMMAQISATEGTLEEREGRIMKNLLHLSGVQVYDIMTPRTVILAIQQDITVGEIFNSNRIIPYSRIPIYGKNVDDIVGFVLRYDILKCAASDHHDVPLRELMRSIHSVPETVTVTKVLDEFTKRQEHIFLVIDEYSGTSGIITMEDALESLLGVEITDESDIVADMRQLAQQRYMRQQALLREAIRTTSPIAISMQPELELDPSIAVS